MSLEVVSEYRGISMETLEDAGLYWVDGDDYAIRIPYPNMKGLWYERKALDPRLDPKGRPKILSPKGATHHLYNPLKLGPNADFVVICEGEYDTLSAIDAGYPAVGSQGTETFAATWARLFTGAIAIIAFDGDNAGRKAAMGLRQWLRKVGGDAYIVEMSEGEDLNDLHKAGDLANMFEDFITENGIDYATS